jgi:hypothetical protein
MKAGLPWSLAFLAIVVAGGAFAATRAATPAPAGKPKPATVQLHRCTDAAGKVTWQDDHCPAGSKDEAREMTRPTDPPRTPATHAAPAPAPAPVAHDPPAARAPQRQLIPPPDMYLCTSYDGIERFSESYDPNPRCEPLVLYYPNPEQLTPQAQNSCRWVQDSCVRLSDEASCERWHLKQKDATSQLQRAFTDTLEYRKSELARINQILQESCP